jgi:hypothetical protein
LTLLGTALAALASVHAACGAVTNLSSSADTTLSENWPSNNFGGMSFVNAGTTQNLTRNRGLYKFDVAGVIPAGSLIRTVSLVLENTGSAGRLQLRRLQLAPFVGGLGRRE